MTLRIVSPIKETEAPILATAIQYLDLKKIFYLRLNSGEIYKKFGGRTYKINLCPEGTSDLLVIINGKPLFIELKKSEKECQTWIKKVEKYRKTAFIPPSAKREVAQHKFIEKARKAGCEVALVGGIDQFIRLIDSF